MSGLWEDDTIQFPRLLAEIMGVGLDEAQWDALCETMYITSDELSELFYRAESRWQRIKEDGA